MSYSPSGLPFDPEQNPGWLMQILFFSEQFWPETNAPAIHVYERAKIWASKGYLVTVITSAPNFPDGILFAGYRNAWRQVADVDGIRVVRVKTYIAANRGVLFRLLDYVSFPLSALLFSLFEPRPDVVISTSPQLLTPLAGVLCAKLRGRPHVFELRDLWPAAIVAVGAVKRGLWQRVLESLELWLYRNSQRILAFTDSFRKDLVLRGIDPDRIHVTPNGTDLERFFPQPRDPVLEAELGLKERFVVGYIGTLGMAHGLDCVLEAAGILAGYPITFLLAGPGAAKEELEKQAQELRLNNVKFLPRQPREAMPALWSQCNVALVHLKNTDLFKTVIPSKMYEAMAMGLPICFAGPEGEATYLIRSKGTGVAIPPEDPKALASAILALREDGETLKRFQAASILARDGFSREDQAERTLAIPGGGQKGH